MASWDYAKAASVITTSPTPILDALEVQFGVPTCAINFAKEALSAFPSPVLESLNSGIGEGKRAANSLVKDVTQKLFFDTGIVEYDTNLGKLVFVSQSNKFGLENAAGQSADNLKGLGTALGFGSQIYLTAQNISEQFEDISNCMNKLASFTGLQKGISANAQDLVGFTAIDPTTGDPVEFFPPSPADEAKSLVFEENKKDLENAIAFSEKCAQQQKNIREILKARKLDPENNPEPVFDARAVNRDPNSPFFGLTLQEALDGRTTFTLLTDLDEADEFEGRPEIIYAEGQKPPVARKGVFLYSQNGIYYDINYGGLDIPDGCVESIVSAVYFDEDGNPYSPDEIPDAAVKWMLDYNPNLGGKGKMIDLKTFNEYANTIFDTAYINESAPMQEYYDEDHFLQVLIDQRNREIYDLSSYVGQLLAGVYTEDSAEVVNARETLYSKIAAHDGKIKRRKKQIEVIVTLSPDGRIPKPGEIPINDLTSLDDTKIGIAKRAQEDIMFSPGEVSGIVLPVCPKFITVELEKEKFSYTDIMVPDVGTGQIITSDPDVTGTSGTVLGLQDAITTSGLVAIYNFLDADLVNPDSNEYLAINCAVSGVSDKPAKLVASSVDSLFPSGIGIPYFRGVCNFFSGSDGSPKASTYTANDEYLFSPYRPYGYAEVKTGYDDMDSLFYKRTGMSFEAWVHVPDLHDATGAGWAADQSTLSLTRVILGCENRGGTDDTDGINTYPTPAATKGLLIGFTRDRRLTSGSVPSNDPADNDITNGINFGIFPTQSYSTSGIGFVGIGRNPKDCEYGIEHKIDGYHGTSVPTDTTVNGVKFDDVSGSFALATITVDYTNDEVKIYLNGNTMVTSGAFDTFGVEGPPNIPSKLDASSFRYGITHDDLPLVAPRFPRNRVGQKDFWYWEGPNAADRSRVNITPFIIGGGYTDGMDSKGTDWYTEGSNTGMNFLGGEWGGKKSGFHGFIGSVKFYNRPLTADEVSANYKAQRGFFENIRT